MKSWFSIDGTLEPIAYDGPSYFRFPLELAEMVISHYSAPGEWVLDPFCGFGTTLLAAQRLGRQGIGIEKDAKRADFAARRIAPPNRVINDNICRIRDYDLPQFNLLFTSPPYGSFRNENWATDKHYFDDLRAIFSEIAHVVLPGAKLIVEISNLRVDGRIQMLAWDAARTMSELFFFEGETVRCNAGPHEAGPGFGHSYLLEFTNKR